jgi:hypothetical protein
MNPDDPRPPQRNGRPSWRMPRALLLSLLVLLCLLLVPLAPGRPAPAGAQSGTLALRWWTVDGGGGTSAGRNFSLSGTMGQPDAGTMRGIRFALAGGFWPGVAAPPAPTPTPSPTVPTPTGTVPATWTASPPVTPSTPAATTPSTFTPTATVQPVTGTPPVLRFHIRLPFAQRPPRSP